MANLIFPTGFEEKETIAENDMILMADSEDSNKIKKAKYSNLKGEQGDPGTPGADGTSATITVGSTTTGAAGSSASVTNSGTSSAAVFDFTIPQGAKGDDGAAATITVGSTTTGNPGTSASVTNSGTSSAAVLNFTIPEGATGNGVASITSSKVGKITTVTITETNGDSESFTVSDGADGQGAGDVVGPNSSTDGNVVLFDGTTGKLIKDSGVALGTAASKDTGTSSGNVPVLDSNGKLATSTLPGVALTDTFTVSTSADLTSLSSADQGDIAIVTSENKTYVLSVAPYSTASNWKEILAPTGGVTSFNGQTGAVTYSAPVSSVNTQTGAVTVNDVKVAAAAPASPTEGMTWYDTANDKLKSYDGSNWNVVGDGDVTGPASSTDGHLALFDGATGKLIKDGGAVPEQNVKVFTLSSTSDLVNAQAAYDWYASGGVPIIKYSDREYYLNRGLSAELYFATNYIYSTTYTYFKTLKFTVSSNTVTGVAMLERTIGVVSSLPSTPDTNTIYFVTN